MADESVRKDAYRTPENILDNLQFERQKLEREWTLLKKIELEELRELSLKNYWFFFTEVLYPDIWKEHYNEDFHKPIFDKVNNLKRGEDLWVFLQREARKSHALNVGRHSWDIIRDPDIRLLLIGAREKTVKGFSMTIRNIFEPGTPGRERFRAVFPDFIFRAGDKQTRQTFEFMCRLRTLALPDPTFRASYLGVTGAGFRCDKLTFDDAVEKRNVTSPEMSRATLTKMLDLLPLVDTKSKYKNIIGMGTRWAYHDPYGAIIGDYKDADMDQETRDALARMRQKRGKIHVIVRHAAENPEVPCKECPPAIMVESPHGTPVSPHDPTAVSIMDPIITLEDLQDKLAQYMMDADLGESLWFHQYNNVCRAPKDRKFQEEWMTVVDRVTWQVVRRRVLALDSANKDFQKAGGDWMVALMGDWSELGKLCIRHGLRSNSWTKNRFIEQIIAHCQRSGWWPSVAIKEKFGEDSFLTDLRIAFLDQGHPIHVYAVTRPTSIQKNDWIIDQLQGPYERGDIIYGSACPAAIPTRRRHELLNLGQIAHEDVADTEALFFCEEVRVKGGDRIIAPSKGMTPPVLGLYDPGRPQLPPNPPAASMVESARQKPQVSRAFAELDGGSDNVQWDRPGQASPVTPGEWNRGTGTGAPFNPVGRKI